MNWNFSHFHLLVGVAVLMGTLAPAVAAEQSMPPVSEGNIFREQDGATLYQAICQGCHMSEGQGAKGAGAFPAFQSNVRLGAADYPVSVVLHGRHGMPKFAGELTDAQVAEVVNYVRSHFENHYTDRVTASDVAKLR